MRVCLMIEGQEALRGTNGWRSPAPQRTRGWTRCSAPTTTAPSSVPSQGRSTLDDPGRVGRDARPGSGSAHWSRPGRFGIRACSRAWPQRSITSLAGAPRLEWGRAGSSAITPKTDSRSSTPRPRSALFEEQVEIVVRTWTEEAFDHTGENYRLRGQTALPKPRPAAPSAAHPRRDGEAAGRRARRALRGRVQHARRRRPTSFASAGVVWTRPAW